MDFVNDLWAEVKRSWGIIMRAKVAFFGMAVLGAVTAWGVCSFYDGKVGDLKAAADESVIKAQKGIIDGIKEERDRANRDNEKLTKQVDDLKIYRGKDAPPLKKTAQILASQIHEFIEKCKDWKGKPQVDSEYAERYRDRFGRRVVLVRDDLDQNGEHSDVLDGLIRDWELGRKVGLDQAKSIADEIENMAKVLPD